MKIIDDENLNQIIQCYPIESRDLLKLQISTIEELLIKHKEKYLNDDNVKIVIDEIIALTLSGKFMNKESIMHE